MTSNYNKVKNEGLEEFKDFYWEQGKFKGRKLGIEQYESFLSTYADKIKEAVEKDIRATEEHDIKRFMDGFAHDTFECEFCKAESSLKP